MKHKLLYSAIGMLLTAAAVTGFIANSAIGRVDDLLQANIEALANGEDAMDQPDWTVTSIPGGWRCDRGSQTCPK